MGMEQISALDSKNLVVKKQVFELLSALSVYSNEGYARALQTLEYFKKQSGERYRFKFIISELRNSQSVDYQTAVLAFINCLILATPELKERVRVRSEFIGLRLLNVLGDLRLQNHKCTDLVVQLDVFDEQKESDDSHLAPTSDGLDLSSPLEVFSMIIRQVSDTPQETPFLCILQHLLRIDAKEPISDLIWDTTERLVHRATLLESSEDASRLLNNAPSHKTKESQAPACGPPPPPPPPSGAPPPPPPPIGNPPPPPQPNGIPGSKFGPPDQNKSIAKDVASQKLPQQSTPIPKTKMRTVNWSKIPSGQILEGDQNNMWASLAKSHSSSKVDLDWSALEGMFCIQRDKPSLTPSGQTGQSDFRNDELERRNSKRDEVIILDAKKSLNINIYIKQFRSSNDDMIQLIKNGSSEEFGSERLRGLLKILPSQDEVTLLESVSPEDSIRLGTAEKFLAQLIKVDGYKLRIEAMLLKEELESCVRIIESSIKSLLDAANDVKTSRELQEVIFMILVAGNFLNSGGYAGDAAGVKLSSLQKIAEIRGNKPGIFLLHFIAMQAENRNPRLISFVDDMVALEEASKTSVDQLNGEILALKAKVTSISQQMENPSVPRDIISQFSKFFKEADLQIDRLKSYLPKIEVVRVDIAHFFCEDLKTFKLEDCFKILFTFTARWKSAAVENSQRKKRELETETRRKAREEQFQKRNQVGFQKPPSELVALNERNKAGALTPDDEIFIACSPRIVRRRLGSSATDNGNASQQSNDSLTLPSPETTPNGSFRRRRSRAPSEEDEAGLMDFLQVSGAENSTEKRSPNEQYGSLDRSWSRKARRRPNLLEFVNDDRERTVSPASGGQDLKIPITNPSPIQAEKSNHDSKHEDPGREWRERIAAWFVDLENCGSGEVPKRKPPQRFQRRLGQDPRPDIVSRNLATLPEGDVGQEEDNLVLRAYQRVYPDRKPSLKLNTDVVGAMEAIEEVQSPVKEKSLWRRPSLISSETESPKDVPSVKTLAEETRRSLIGSLGGKSADADADKLVLYIPQSNNQIKSDGLSPESYTKPKSPLFDSDLRHGTQEGFDRFASIRRSRRIKRPEFSTPTLPRKNIAPTQRFVSKVDITAEPSPQAARNDKTEVIVNAIGDVQNRNAKLVKARHVDLPSPTSIEPVTATATVTKDEHKTDKPGSPITFSIGQKVNNKGKTINGSFGTGAEHDEGFEESQSSLSETNSQGDPNVLTVSALQRNPRSPTRLRHSFREPSNTSRTTHSEANGSIRSVLTPMGQSIRRKSLQENTPIPPPVNNNGCNNTSSRTSLLSSISSLTSQTTVNTVRDVSDSKLKNSMKPNNESLANSNRTRFLNTSFRANGHSGRNVLNNKNTKNELLNIVQNNSNAHEQLPSKESLEKGKSSPTGLKPRFPSFNFLRPTASSSAKDKIDSLKAKGSSKSKKSFK